ncbi:uncharacterized protein [Antedon mediterranea]
MIFKKKLQDVIKQRETVDETADLLEKMKLESSGTAKDPKTRLSDGSILKDVQKFSFKPFESLRSKSIPANVERTRVASSRGNLNVKSKSQTVMEYSNVVSPLGKFGKTMIIPLEESQKLLVQQKEQYEDLQAQQAAERLAERMHLTMGEYEQQTTDVYRETEEATISEDEDETRSTADLTDLIDETM